LKSILLALAGALATFAPPALAQETATVEPVPAQTSDPRGDFAIAGLGIAVLPEYEGSSDYAITPIPAAIGQFSGYRFILLGNRLSVDLIRDGYGPTWDVQAGPFGVVNFNRNSSDAIDDPQVALLDERGTAIELGGYVGIGKTGVLTSDFDRLSATVSYRYDVSGVHDSGILTPTIAYTTPLSTKSLVGLFVSAERVERGFGRAYFSVSPEESLRSGLPVYDARGGWKNYAIGLTGMRSLTGDLTGGLQLVVGGLYRRLLNDFGDSPVTSIAGSRNQWLGTVGVAYSF
jgi:outer membrane protein